MTADPVVVVVCGFMLGVLLILFAVVVALAITHGRGGDGAPIVPPPVFGKVPRPRDWPAPPADEGS